MRSTSVFLALLLTIPLTGMSATPAPASWPVHTIEGFFPHPQIKGVHGARVTLSQGSSVSKICAGFIDDPSLAWLKGSVEDCVKYTVFWTWSKEELNDETEALLRNIQAEKDVITMPFLSQERYELLATVDRKVREVISPFDKAFAWARDNLAQLTGRVKSTEDATAEVSNKIDVLGNKADANTVAIVATNERIGANESATAGNTAGIIGLAFVVNDTIEKTSQNAVTISGQKMEISSLAKNQLYTWIGMAIMAILVMIAMVVIYRKFTSVKNTLHATLEQQADPVADEVSALTERVDELENWAGNVKKHIGLGGLALEGDGNSKPMKGILDGADIAPETSDTPLLEADDTSSKRPLEPSLALVKNALPTERGGDGGQPAIPAFIRKEKA